MTNEKTVKGGARSSARLAAVQALYQIEASGSPSIVVTREFVEHRLGEIVDDEKYSKADAVFFTDLVIGVDKRVDEIDEK